MSGLVRGIDVASYQPRDLTAIIQQYQPEHVVVHLYSSVESVPWSYSADQIKSAQANGCTVGGYVFLYPGANHVQAINSVLERCASIDLVLPILWLDVETYNGRDLIPAELMAAVDMCSALETPCGLYTSREMFRRVGNPTGFETLPVWVADYNGVPDLNVPAIPNLPNVVAHQYRGDPLDLDVFLEEYTRLPVADPCAALRAGLQAIVDARPYKTPSKKKLKAILAA